MFTGIIEEIGIVKEINKNSNGVLLKIRANSILKDTKLGDSIGVNGVCLTVTSIKNNILSFDAIKETLKNTTLEKLKTNNCVNLERSLKANSRLGGHFVTGHIDYKGKIKNIIKKTGDVEFVIELPSEYSDFVVKKGSISIDGISLTVAKTTNNSFTICLIPHTLKITTLGKKKKGDLVNIETDLLGKYTLNRKTKTNLKETLKKYGYI